MPHFEAAMHNEWGQLLAVWNEDTQVKERRRTSTAFAAMPNKCWAGSVANRCTMVSGSSRSRSASTKEGYLSGTPDTAVLLTPHSYS